MEKIIFKATTCMFFNVRLFNSSSPLLGTGSGGIICQKTSLKFIDVATYLDYHVAINLLALILLT